MRKAHGASVWLTTLDLKPGDRLVTADGRGATFRSASLRDAFAQTYNLEVADTHTFLVGDDGVVVHNCPASEKFARRLAGQIERLLGKDARRELHDMKDLVEGDRTRAQLREDARSLFSDRGLPIPPWLRD